MLEMTEREKFLFDLQGFLHVKDLLTAEEVKALNDAVDANVVPMEEYEWTGPNQYAGGMDGKYSIRTAHGMLTWEQPWCQPFRNLMAYPKAIPYLNSLFGRGWRLERGPSIIMARKGCGGHGLHGYTSRQHDGAQHYTYANGKFRTGMTIFQYQLRDVEEGMGGVTVMPGSHKANFKCPEDIMLHNTDKEAVRNIGCKAGDLVIFMETTIHGSLPWKLDYERRSLMYHSPDTTTPPPTIPTPWRKESAAASRRSATASAPTSSLKPPAAPVPSSALPMAFATPVIGAAAWKTGWCAWPATGITIISAGFSSTTSSSIPSCIPLPGERRGREA